jgi:predicted Holliday junction resolvase-like endonuclease
LKEINKGIYFDKVVTLNIYYLVEQYILILFIIFIIIILLLYDNEIIVQLKPTDPLQKKKPTEQTQMIHKKNHLGEFKLYLLRNFSFKIREFKLKESNKKGI